MNLDLDTIRLPLNLKDGVELLCDPLRGIMQNPIPEDQKDGIIPPLPFVPRRDILREIHILLPTELVPPSLQGRFSIQN